MRRRQDQLPPAGFRVGSDRDIDQDQVGERSDGRRLHELTHSRLDPGDQVLRCLALALRAPLQFGDLFAQQRHFLVGQSPVVLGHLGGNALARDNRLVDAVQALPPQPDAGRDACLAAGRIDESDIGSYLGLGHGGRQPQYCKP